MTCNIDVGWYRCWPLATLLSLSFVSPVLVLRHTQVALVMRALDCDHAQPRTGHQIWSQASQVKKKRLWEVCDDRLQFMSQQDALLLDESLRYDDVSRAWLVWSGAAETALADAYRFGGGLVPARGLVLGRGSALFRFVRLGGQKVR